MTCNDKCMHYPVCEMKNYDFANIDECQYYEEKRPITIESAIDYLTKIGWLYHHDKELTQERPHGEWKLDNVGVYCSKCKKHPDYSSDFCPNCGADMREGEADG